MANYLLCRIDREGMDASDLAKRLLSRGVAIRVCANFQGLDRRYFRVAVRSEKDNRKLVEALREILVVRTLLASPRRTPALMFQGLTSSAGKSVLSAAFCRILLQDGYNVFPFKSQNMALNSFVTAEGKEMGRAQVVQAQACRKDPDVRMNPILLKPNSDTGCQVIVMGAPVGNMNVTEYVRYKPQAWEKGREAYDSLAREADCLVIEGAGSPAEVNLKHHDIVNMRVAEYASAPVLLVGDIDRGGVFASFVGTMEVLDRWERDLVAGFVINRFRGDARLLEQALDFTERRTGKPVLGVVPYLTDLGLPEEDSVAFKSGVLDRNKNTEAAVEIAVVDLPHISNFNDFDPFRIEPDVKLTIVRSREDLNEPEAVIIPGSKNVIGDLKHLVEKGIADRILELLARGRTQLIGICGGFQMLGQEIRDPHGIESADGSLSGLGILPVSTTLLESKTLVQTSALHLPSNMKVKGYEIHHGRTDAGSLPPMIRRPDGEVIGAGLPDGRVWGTYLHGIFDTDEFRRWFIDSLRSGRGLAPLGKVAARYDLDAALDRLAAAVREKLPVERIYRIMGLI
jgi:cobyric acid synthase CobQ